LTFTAFFDTEEEMVKHISYYSKIVNLEEKYKKEINLVKGI
jgi:hypothetical protein